MMPNSDLEGRNFYSHRKLMYGSFSCIPFDIQCFILNVAFITIHNDIAPGRFEI